MRAGDRMHKISGKNGLLAPVSLGVSMSEILLQDTDPFQKTTGSSISCHIRGVLRRPVCWGQLRAQAVLGYSSCEGCCNRGNALSVWPKEPERAAQSYVLDDWLLYHRKQYAGIQMAFKKLNGWVFALQARESLANYFL